jgi:hypothetical protein
MAYALELSVKLLKKGQNCGFVCSLRKVSIKSLLCILEPIFKVD